MIDSVLAPSGAPLKDELTARLERARSEGLVHAGMTVDVVFATTTPDLLQVLNNVLRLREQRPEPTYSF